MAGLLGLFSRLWSDEGGQGLVEYALIIALVALLVVAAILTLSGKLNTIFGTVSNCLNSANTGAATTTTCP